MMGNDTASTFIAAHELLMRRVVASPTFFARGRPPESPVGPTFQAFNPFDKNPTGISLSRMRSDDHPEFLTIDAFAALACSGKPPEKHFYVAILSAGQLMAAPLALELKPDPMPDDPGHILVPRLHSTLDKPTRNGFMNTLAREYCLRVVGPYNCDGKVVASYVDWQSGS